MPSAWPLPPHRSLGFGPLLPHSLRAEHAGLRVPGCCVSCHALRPRCPGYSLSLSMSVSGAGVHFLGSSPTATDGAAPITATTSVPAPEAGVQTQGPGRPERMPKAQAGVGGLQALRGSWPRHCSLGLGCHTASGLCVCAQTLSSWEDASRWVRARPRPVCTDPISKQGRVHGF